MAPRTGRKLGGGRIVLNTVAVINRPRNEPGALKASNQPPFGPRRFPSHHVFSVSLRDLLKVSLPLSFNPPTTLFVSVRS